ncbi:hypothetical protein [Ewingella americana]|uniref:Uncharacterized protein n=1 Tax=Ewingella americana TaxID=41202 RepID=A0A502GGE8_9GAMM|nr:hypothetical protein [Ewingella americana]TPG60036.1 hypothetical protein EAH77_15830 [Ewingella americana]
MSQKQLSITIAVPHDVELDYFKAAALGFLQYQIFHVSDFWEGLAELLYAAHKAGDRELLDKIGSKALDYKDIPGLSKDVEVDYTPSEHKSTIVKDDDNPLTSYARIPVEIHTEICEYQQDIWMNIPCNMKNCKHYCNSPEFFNCGYSAADIENPGKESIAYQLGVPVGEIDEVLEGALSKLRKSILKEEYLEPTYDVLNIEGFCESCNTKQDNLLTFDKGCYCEECVENYSELGCNLIKTYQLPLKKLLQSTFRYHKNLNYQALSLNVQPKELTDLYYRVGIIKHANNAKPSMYLMNKRPGRAIKIENAEYFNLNAISALSYQKPSADVLQRLMDLAKRVNSFVEMESIAEYCE